MIHVGAGQRCWTKRLSSSACVRRDVFLLGIFSCAACLSMSLRGFIYKLQFMSWAVPGPGAAECGLLFPHHASAGGWRAGGFVRRCPGPALRGGAGRLVFVLVFVSLLKNSARLAHFSVYHFSRNSKLVVADAVGVSLSRFPTLLGSTRLSCSCTNSPSPAVLLHTASDDRTDLEAITAYVP